MRVLVGESEHNLGRFMGQGLTEQGHAVELACDGHAVVERLSQDPPYDLVVLDVALPKRGGLDVLKVLRTHRIDTLVLLLTERDRRRDVVAGLELGADAVLTKPFAFEEFGARVRALLRRRSVDRRPVLGVGDLFLDPAAHRVTRGGRKIELTRREYALLEYMLRNAGQALTRDTLAEHVWGLDHERESNVVDVYVGYLRGKIEGAGAAPLLHTVRGVGYMLSAAA